jgi:hypothetical protein
VTREAAEAEVQRLGREHPERDRHRWLARERNGMWEVVKVPITPGHRVDPLKTRTEPKPMPPELDDPRTSYARNVGGPWPWVT